MRRILLLMASRTYRAQAFLAAAGRLRVEVTIGTEQEHILSTPGATVAIDFRHPRRAQRQIVDFARDYPLDAVVGVDDDTTLVAALGAEALGLPHNTPESVKAARYKDVMRLILAETELNSPEFRLVGMDQDPLLVATNLEYPCVVKPLSLSASRGVIRANNPSEFAAAFQVAADVVRETDLPENDPASSQLLVESFIPGQEVALEGLLVAGRLTVLALFDKPDPLDGPYFEETIYVTPSRLPAETQASITQAAARASEALGLRDGPIHAELRVNARGVWVVEVAPRSIGGLCSRSLRFDAGLSLEEIVLRQAAGLESGALRRESRPSGVMMIPIPRAGILHEVYGCTQAKRVPGVEDVVISMPRKSEVVPLPRGSKYLGFIFAHGETPEAVEAALREAHACLEFDIQTAVPMSADRGH